MASYLVLLKLRVIISAHIIIIFFHYLINICVTEAGCLVNSSLDLNRVDPINYLWSDQVHDDVFWVVLLGVDSWEKSHQFVVHNSWAAVLALGGVGCDKSDVVHGSTVLLNVSLVMEEVVLLSLITYLDWVSSNLDLVALNISKGVCLDLFELRC